MKALKALLITLIVLSLSAAVALAEAAMPAQVGQPAPDFELQTLDGDTFRLSEQLGKVVFINAWATWCPPCVAEVPDIQRLADAHPDDLIVIGASIDDGEVTVRDFMAQMGCTYPVAMDAEYTILSKLYPSQYIPESVFVAPDGVVVSIDIGGLTYEQMEQRFQDALKHTGAN